VQNGDTIGKFTFEAADGARFWSAGDFRTIINGTVGGRRLPTDITFNTTPDATNFSGNTFEVFRATNNERLGVGTTSPDAKLHVEISDAVTAATTEVLRVTHISTGAVADDFGASINTELEGADGTNLVASSIETAWDDSATGTEDSRIIFRVAESGASAASGRNLFRLNDSGFNLLAREGLIFSSSTSAGAGATIELQRTRDPNYVIGGAAVQDGDSIGKFAFTGDDGINPFLTSGAEVEALVNGTPSSQNIPMDMFFKTQDIERMSIKTTGEIGIGTMSPDRLAHIEASDAVTNSTTPGLRISHITSGTAAGGFGVSVEMELEGADGTNLVAGEIETVWTDASTGAEDADILFKVAESGVVAAERARLTSAGRFDAVDGFEVSPGSDVDVNVVTVDVTGQPGITWDESSDGFRINGGATGLVLGADGDLTHTIGGATVTSQLEIHSEGSGDLGGVAIHRHTDVNNFGGHLLFFRSDGTHASPSLVDSGDTLGRIVGLGYDGTDYEPSSEIRFVADNVTGNNDMPGRIVFFTTPDGSTTLAEAMRVDSRKSIIAKGRIQGNKGSDVASANNITLGTSGNYFDITGTTQINTIASTNWQAGSVVVLQFDSSLTVAHNTAGSGASILLSGASNFSATANDTLMLIYDGATWREVARTAI
jgi:hypothetical protein